MTKDSVLAALRTVADPQSGSDIVTAGIARAVTVEDGAVRFVLGSQATTRRFVGAES